MWIKEVSIRNLLCFRTIDLKFRKGTIGIFGPNGSGKTTIINLIYAAITNDFSRFEAFTKDQLTNEDMGRKDAAFVRVIFEHSDEVFDVTRSMVPDKSTMTVGPRSFTSAKEISNELKRVDLDFNVLANTVFKRDMTDFISSTPAKRAEVYKAIMPTQECGQIHKVLNQFLLENKDQMLIDNREELKKSIGENAKQIEELEKKRTEAQGLLLSEDTRIRLKEIVEDWKSEKERKGNLNSAKQKIETTGQQITELSKSKESHESILEDRQKRLNSNKLKLQEIEQNLKATASLKKLHGQRNALLEKKKLAIKQLKELDANVLTTPKRLKERKQVGKELDHLRGELDVSEKAIQHVKSGHLEGGACFLCGQDLGDPQQFVVSLQEKIGKLKISIKDLFDTTKAIDEYLSEKETRDRKREQFQKSRNQHEEMLESMGTLDEPVSDEKIAEMEKWINQSQQYENEVRQATAKLSEINSRISNLEGVKRTVESEVEKLVNNKKKLSKKDYREAIGKRLEHRLRREDIAKWSGELKALRGETDRLRKSIQEIRDRRKSMENFKKIRTIVERVAGVFHWDSLPKITTQSNLKLIEKNINQGLMNFGNPFRVTVVDDFGFDVLFSGKRPRPMASLSVGQRFIFAVAFWPVVSSLDLLVMDEPTANLDAGNRRYLRDALQKLTQSLRDRRQMIMVTHAAELESSFDQVIHLE